MIASMLLTAALTASLLPPPGGADDLVPAAIDSVLAQPTDPFFYGQPFAAAGVSWFRDTAAPANARTMIDLPDVDDDGVADFAVGYDDLDASATLHARSGATGARLWSDSPGGGFFRVPGGLARDGDRLAVAVTSAAARVELRHVADGGVIWATDLAREPDGASLAAAYQVRFVEDLDDDDIPDLLVAAGVGVGAAVLLSGADGSEIWRHATGDTVYGVTLTGDCDGDGTPDVAFVGGDVAPVLGLLSGAEGSLLWSQRLTGPGSAVVAGHDLDDDDLGDLVVGTFSQPESCLFAYSLADGAQIWSSDFVITDDVLSIDPLDDVDEDGRTDWLIAGFDNAANAVTATGFVAWRSEVTVNNGGHVLAARPAGDLDGEGTIDVICTSVDHWVYAFDGKFGFLLWAMDLRARGTAVTALPDPAGVGKPGLAVAAKHVIEVFDGGSGLASGPEVFFNEHAGELNVVTEILSFTYPGAHIILFAALGTGELVLPGYDQPFGLDLGSLGVVAEYPGPPAGGQGFQIPPLPRDLVGSTIFVQSLEIYQNGHRLLSDVESFDIVDG